MDDFLPVRGEQQQQQDSSANVTVFTGNTNTHEVVTHVLRWPVHASVIRVVPRARPGRRTPSRTPCLRLELLGCESPYDSE